MKSFVLPFILGLLLLVGCDGADVVLTETVVAQLPMDTVTTAPPTIMPATQFPTTTPEFLEMTNTPHPPAATPVPIPTVTPSPTLRPTDTLDPSLPPLTGQIFMFWDPNLPKQVDFAFRHSYNFYKFTAGVMPEINIIDIALAITPEPLFMSSAMEVSPDKKKIALLLLGDTNGNGKIDLSGYNQDYQTVYMYDIVNDDLVPFATGEHGIHYISWFPDSLTLLYPQGENVLMAGLDGSLPESIANFPDAYINNITLSPDGHSLVTDRNHNQIQAYDFDTSTIVAITDDKQVNPMVGKTQWSPDGNLLALGQHSLFQSLFNVETAEFTALGLSDDIVYPPSWSPDGQWLAMSSKQTRDASVTKLSLWNRDTLAITEILTGTFISPPIWSPLDNIVTVGLINDNMGILLAIDINSGAIQEWRVGDDVQEVRVLSYSPDGNWIAFIAVEDDSAALYVAPLQGGNIYLMLDIVDGDAIGEFVWLPDL